MTKKSFFHFKSITHRLIFGCVAAAIAIYGGSYWHARQLVQTTVGGWMTDIAQSRINTVVNEIEGRLKAIEQSVLIPIQIGQRSPLDVNANSVQTTLLPLLKPLVEQQPQVQAIALIDPVNATGWHYVRSAAGYTNLNGDKTKSWLTHCPIERITASAQPFWTQPYSLNTTNPTSGTSGITYCIPLSSADRSTTNVNRQLLAIEVKLDWVSPFMVQQLTQLDEEVKYLKVGDPFVLSPANEFWIVSPANPQLVQPWFSSQNINLRDYQQGNGLVNAKTNSQSTLITATVPSKNWVIGIVFPAAKLAQFQQKYFWLLVFSMSKDMVLMCMVIAFLSRRTTRPLRALITSTEEMAQGNLGANLPTVTIIDEVGRLTQAFRHMRDSLQIYIHNLQETTAAKQKLESELAIAAQIQRSMVPRTGVVSSANSPYEISAILKPARIVGGDLYDFFLLGSDRLCLIIGDVADKGFPAALLMARTVTLIRTLTKTLSTPSEILTTVNRELCAENEECLFVTVFCGVLELGSGKFTYASGGHDAPLLIHNQQVQYLDVETSPPLGLYEDEAFGQSECVLAPNDLILFYTDGITEAMNSHGEIFSEIRLIEIMISYPPTNPARAIRTVQHFCQQFVGDEPQSDDITLLAVQYLPSSPFSQVTNVMEWNLTINSELTELEEVKQTLDKILQAASLTMELIEDVQLIVEEVLVNIIQYGYENRSGGFIDLRLEMNTKRLTMIFADGGKPFNPLTEIAIPDLSIEDIDDEERSQGGFGFFLVQELAEEVDYVYLNGKNILTVCLAIA